MPLLEGRNVLTKFIKRLSLSGHADGAAAVLGEILHPVLDVDSLLRDVRTTRTLVNITAVGGKNLVTVPADERWWLYGYRFVLDAGTYTFDAMGVIGRTDDVSVLLEQFAGVVDRSSLLTGQTVRIDPGGVILVRIASFTVAGNLAVDLLTEREKIGAVAV